MEPDTGEGACATQLLVLCLADLADHLHGLPIVIKFLTTIEAHNIVSALSDGFPIGIAIPGSGGRSERFGSMAMTATDGKNLKNLL